MNKFIEDENILTFGNKSIDVSNVSQGRIDKASIMWDKEATKEDYTKESINKMIMRVGLYLIKQDFDVLRLRMTFFKAVKSFIYRYLLTAKHIKKSNKKEFEAFEDWIYFTMTGNKKKELEMESRVINLIAKQFMEMEKQGITPEQCMELLSTFVADQAKQSKVS